MYVDEPELTALRQGDILPVTRYTIPAICSGEGDTFTIPPVRVKMTRLVIVSQCCELALIDSPSGSSKMPRRKYALVTPWVDSIPFTEGSEEYDKLIRNGQDREDNDPVQYFYYEGSGQVGGSGVIDLSAVFPLRTADLYRLCANKIAELTPVNRHLLRQRLITYFGRIPEEEEIAVEAML